MPTFEDLEELKEVLKSIKDVKKKVLKGFQLSRKNQFHLMKKKQN